LSRWMHSPPTAHARRWRRHYGGIGHVFAVLDL
jgi:hypothetical protein